MGAIFMTAFFMLSGFSLFEGYKTHDLSNFDSIKKFYLKRFLKLFITYYVMCLGYILFLNSLSLKDNLMLLPLETLGLQSTFNGLFSLSHNNGTWCITSFALCYFVFPLIHEIVKNLTKKQKMIILVVLSIVLIQTPFVITYFQIDNNLYTNPFFRLLEFSIGVIICSFKDDYKIKNNLLMIMISIVSYVLLIVGVTYLVKTDFYVNNYMAYNIINVPIFAILLYCLGNAKIELVNHSKVINNLSKLTYSFFFAQFFTWYVFNKINHYAFIRYKLLSAVMINLIISILIFMIADFLTKRILKIVYRDKKKVP